MVWDASKNNDIQAVKIKLEMPQALTFVQPSFQQNSCQTVPLSRNSEHDTNVLALWLICFNFWFVSYVFGKLWVCFV